MKKIIVALSLILLYTSGFAQSYKKTDYGASAQINSMDIEVQSYGPSIVRVVKTPVGKRVEKESVSVIKSPEKESFTTKGLGAEL